MLALAVGGCSTPKQGPFMPSIFSTFDVKPGPTVRINEDGVPEIKPWSTNEFTANPTTVAQWGLGAAARYAVSSSDADRDIMRRASDWLVKVQQPNGGFPLTFNHIHPDPNGYRLMAPWYSAISQANGISLLVRTYQETADKRYLETAVKALDLLDIPLEQGGLQGRIDGGIWFEETPDAASPNHIFNGSIFALLGINDLYRATGNEKAWRLWMDGTESLRRNLNKFIVRESPEDPTLPMPWSIYELKQYGEPKKPHYLTDFYMGIHIKLMREMAERTGQVYYTTVADLWEKSMGEYLKTHPK